MINTNKINGFFQHNPRGWMFEVMPFSFEERRLFIGGETTYQATELEADTDTDTDTEADGELSRNELGNEDPNKDNTITKDDIVAYDKRFNKEANNIITKLWITETPSFWMEWLKTLSPSVHKEMLEFQTEMKEKAKNITDSENVTDLLKMMNVRIWEIESKVNDKKESISDLEDPQEIKLALLMDEATEQKSESEKELDSVIDAACEKNMISWLLWPDIIKSIIKKGWIMGKILTSLLWLKIEEWTLEWLSSQDNTFNKYAFSFSVRTAIRIKDELSPL